MVQKKSEKKYPPTNSARILIVEDEFFIAQSMQTKLIEQGYPNCEVTDAGEKALQKAESEKPDLAIIDIRLQGEMDGIQTANLIRSRWKIPILFLTSHVEEMLQNCTSGMEAEGYLVKPFTDRELHAAIQMALYKAKIEKQLKASEERFQLMVNYTDHWEYGIDPQGKLVFVAPACEKITGYRMEEFYLNPKLFFSLVFPEDRPRVMAHRECHTQESPRSELEYRILTKTGEVRWIHHVCRSIYGADGEWLGRKICNQDITEHKLLEIEHFKLMEELLKSLEKVKALSSLLPVCPVCKKIRTHQGYWLPIEGTILENSPGDFLQDYCPDCAQKLRPNFNKNGIAAGALKKVMR